MVKKCINCNSLKISNSMNTKRPQMEGVTDVEFIDIQFKCEKCGYSFNCVGAKEINTS